MPRNLDLTALRSFTAVADAGGVTRAATQLNLTQSAVSMQLKRLEEKLGLPLLDRSARTIALTAQGEQLLGYARRLLALNDEAWGRLTNPAFEGEIDLRGAARHHLPARAAGAAALRAGVSAGAGCCCTRATPVELKERFARGEMDLILTTEGAARSRRRDAGAEPLVWVGAPGGQAWRVAAAALRLLRPLRLQRPALEALERRRASPGSSRSNSISCSAVEVSVIADLAISVQLAERRPGRAARRSATAARCRSCPTTASTCTSATGRARRSAERLAALVRQAYGVARVAGGGVGRRRRPAPPPCRWRGGSRSSSRPGVRPPRAAGRGRRAGAAGPCACQAKSVSRLARSTAGCARRPGAQVEADHASGSSPAAGWPGSAAPRRRRSRSAAAAPRGGRRAARRRSAAPPTGS